MLGEDLVENGLGLGGVAGFVVRKGRLGGPAGESLPGTGPIIAGRDLVLICQAEHAMNDDEMLKSFEDCTFPFAEWNQRAAS